MNTAKPEAPEMLALKLKLSLDTRVDQHALQKWLDDNDSWIGDALADEGVVTLAHPDCYNEIYAWSCQEFRRSVAARTPQPQLAPIQPAESRASPSAAEPAGMFSRLFRRRAP